MTLRGLLLSVDAEAFANVPLYEELLNTKPEYGAGNHIDVKLVNEEITVSNVHVGSLGDIVASPIDVAPDLHVTKKDGSWRLSPAYDITYIIDGGGYLPNEDHCLYVRAKLRNITREDVIQFAHDNGIRRPDSIIRDVVGALKQFRSVATKYGVSEQWTGRVEATIIGHMKTWGEWEGEEQTKENKDGRE